MKVIRAASGLALASVVVFSSSAGCLVDSYRCEGGKVACKGRLLSACAEADGCNIAPGCVVAFCMERGTKAWCEQAPVCRWDESSYYKCSQHGDGGCIDLPQPKCEGNPSCRWSDACLGEPVDCADFDSARSCGAHHGCVWSRIPSLN